MLLLSSIFVVCLLTKLTLASFMQGGDSAWHGVPNYGVTNYGANEHNLNHIHQDISPYGSYTPYGIGNDLHLELNHGFNTANVQHTLAHAIPISEHVEVTKPVAVPIVKNVGIPVAQPVAIPVPYPVAVGVPQPYPVHVPVARPVAVPVVKTIAIPVEKKVPYPVEKIVPVPIEKAIPITVEKHVPVPVEKPYPVHVPIYKHVFHRKATSHGRGWIF